MKKRNKIIITMLMVIIMLSVMAVSTFASGNVLKGEYIEGGADINNPIGTWVFNNTLPNISEYPVNTLYFDFISNETEFEYIAIEDNSVIRYYLYRAGGYSGTPVYYEQDNSFVWANQNYKTIEITDYNMEQESEIIEFLNTYATKTAPILPGENTTGILDVASEIPSFLVNVFVPLISIFYVDGAFTIIGVLSLAAFAFFLILLLFQVIKRFVQFRG